MFAVGNGFDEIRSSGSIPLSLSEEKFDYTESEFDENDDSAVSEGNIRLDRSFNFRGFMDRLTGKQKALELAHQLDVKRGVSSGMDELVSPDALTEQPSNDEKAPAGAIRRVPSGARHAAVGTTLEATPVRQTTQGKGSDLLLMQSTPLAKPATLSRTQPKDLLREKLIENHNRKASGNSVNSGQAQRDMVQEQKDLREEMSRLQEELAALENRQLKKDGEISQLNRTLNDKDMQLAELKKQLESKNGEIMSQELKAANANQRMRALEDELREQTDKVRTLEKALETATVEAEAERTGLNKDLEQVTLEYKKYKVETRLHLNETSNMLRQSEEKNKELKATLEDKTNEVNDLGKRIAIKENEVSNLNSLLAESNAMISKLQADKNTLNVQLDIHKQELDAATSKLNSLKAEFDQLKNEKDTEINTLQADIEGNWKQKLVQLEESDAACKELMAQIEKSDKANKELSAQLNKKETELGKITEQVRRITSEKDSLRDYIDNVKWFEVPVGSIILDLFKKTRRSPMSYKSILSEKYEIVGFRLTSDEELLNNLRAKVESLENSNTRLQEELETKIKNTKEVFGTQEASMKKDIIELREDLKARSAKIDKLQSVIDGLQKDAAALLKEKEESVNKNIELSQHLAQLQEDQLQRDNTTFLELCQKNQEILKYNHEMMEKMHVMEAELRSVVKASHDLQSSISEKESVIKEKQQIIADLQLNLNQLRKNLEKLKGNPADMISFESAQRIYHNLDRKMYNTLMVDQVNQLDIVELQNVVKNIILLLETPFSKLSKKMPLVSIYLRYEKSLCFHFANKLHFHVYQEPIDIKKFTNDAYSQYLERHDITKIKHPLEICLEKLYDEVRSRLKY
ncbi:AaceriABL193Cp [[Ashbya] aceris (nom. inval.)]|nr:AaceriABL193Cp [[Ashbya] aceris (nom. inval.)]